VGAEDLAARDESAPALARPLRQDARERPGPDRPSPSHVHRDDLDPGLGRTDPVGGRVEDDLSPARERPRRGPDRALGAAPRRIEALREESDHHFAPFRAIERDFRRTLRTSVREAASSFSSPRYARRNRTRSVALHFSAE